MSEDLSAAASVAGGVLPSVGAETEMREDVVREAVEWMERYTARLGKEAVGFVMQMDDGRQVWRGLSNTLSGEDGMHRFRIAPESVQSLTAWADAVGADFLAQIHSHPFSNPGVAGAQGPSPDDLMRRARAERGLVDGFELPESAVWCPTSGRAGVLVGYDGSGIIWRWNA